MSLFKKISATAAVLAAAGALVATEAQATEGYFQNAVGARHKGLAGAGIADGKDATIINLNPAGLVHAGRQFNGAVSLFMPFRQYETTGAIASPFPASGKVKSDRNIFAVPNLAYSHPLDEDRTIGFSLSGNGGMNTTYKAVGNPGCPPGFPGGVFCGGKSGVDLTQVNISAAYAQKLGNHFSFGISPIFAIQRFKAKGLSAFGAFGQSNDPTSLTNRGYDYSYGGGVRVGVEFMLSDSIRVGASYQSKLYMSRFKKYSGLFAQSGDFDVPSNFQAGVAFDVTPDLTLMADYRYINYSEVRAIANKNPGTFLGDPTGSGFGWKDVSTIKFGAEYKATEDLTVRAGYSYNTQPIPKSQVLFNILAPATVKHHITGGASYKYSPNSEFEFAAMFAPSVSVTGPTSATQSTKIKMHQLEFTLGYNYHWN